MNKIINEHGEVAVLINGGYGIGWYSAAGEYANDLIFDGAVVNMVLAKADGWQQEVINYCSEKYPDFYCVPYNIEVQWIRAGREFYITEYDGNESIEYPEYLTTFVA